MSKTIARSALAACGLMLATAAGAQTLAPNLAHGQAVYHRWCAPCHDPSIEHPGTLALGVKYQGKRPAVLLAWPDLTADYVKYVARTGVSIMPLFRKTEISDSELQDLADYMATHPLAAKK